MTMRKIDQKGGKLGTVGAYKKRHIASVTVVPLSGTHELLLEVTSHGRHVPPVHLTPRAAVEVVKGVLLNVYGPYLAADDELLAIMKGVIAEGERVSDGVAEALKNRGEPQ